MSITFQNRPLMIEMEIKVRTYDIDSAGHVSNIKYLYWMEDMRLEVLERYCPMKPLLESGHVPVIVSTEIHYKKAIKLFDKPRGFMWISKVGKVSYTFEGEIYVDDELATRAVHTGVFVDPTTGRPRRLPRTFMDRFEQAQKDQIR